MTAAGQAGGQGKAHWLEVVGPTRVGLIRVARFLCGGGAYFAATALTGKPESMAAAAADHEHDARPVAPTDDNVAGAGRTVEVVPPAQRPLLLSTTSRHSPKRTETPPARPRGDKARSCHRATGRAH